MADKTPQVTIEELRERLVALNTQAQTVQATADDEKRGLSEQEEKQISDLFLQFEETEKEIERREKIQAQSAKLSTPQPRKTTPEPTNGTDGEPVRGRITGGDYSGAVKGLGGFRSAGEFAQAVVGGSAKGATPDKRLQILNATTFGSESSGADGGFAVPPDLRADIVKLINGEESLLGRTDQQNTSSNQLTVPTDETTAWQTSGGILATWEGEGSQLTQSKPALKSVTVRATKLTVLTPVTDELLEDAAALGSYLRSKAPEKINYKVNDALINGTGAGMPLGILNSPALVTVSESAGHGAGTVILSDLTSMWARMYAPYRNDAVWLINQDVEPYLQTLTIQGSNSGVFPVYLPPGGFSGSPYATLYGRPIIVTEACATAGTVGDIILWSPKQYLSVVKGGGIRQDVSIHLWFDYDQVAFRWVLRCGGMPWLSTPITRAHGSNTLSSIVCVATRT